jgi:hypothetical protein
MADEKISGLTAATASGGSDLIPIVQNGENKRSSPNVLGINYSFSELTNVTVGGLPAGSNITNQNASQILKQILVDYLSPSFTSFDLNGISVLECGDKIAGIQEVTWSISNSVNVQDNTIDINDITNALSLIAGHSVASPAFYDFTDYPSGGLQYDTPTTNIWQIQGTNTQLTTFTINLSRSWQWLKYWGTNASDTLTEAQIKALINNQLSNTGFGTYNFVAIDSQYKYICVQESLPQPTIFKDSSTGFDIAMATPYTVSVTNTFGVIANYTIYRTYNQLGGAITIMAS